MVDMYNKLWRQWWYIHSFRRSRH